MGAGEGECGAGGQGSHGEPSPVKDWSHSVM